MQRPLNVLLSILFVAALVLVALPQLWYPLWFDQGAFSACADVIRRGGVMYRDCWDVRGPLASFAYVIPKLFSSSPIAIRFFDLACAAATAYVIGLFVRDLFGEDGEPLRYPLPSLVAGGLYWLMYATLNYWSVGQAEGFANLFVVVAAWLSWRAINREDWEAEHYSLSNYTTLLVASGWCAGMVIWFKYPFVLFVALLAVLIWRRAPIRQQQSLGYFGAGVLSVCGVALVYFAINGAFEAFFTHLQYDMVTFANVPLQARWQWFSGLFIEEIWAFARMGSTPTAGFKDTVPQIEILGRGYPFIVLLGLMGAGLALSWAQHRLAGWLVVGYLAIGILINIWQGHSYRYHFIVWLPAMAILAGSAFVRRGSTKTGTSPNALVVFAWAHRIALLLVLLAFTGLITAMLPWLRDAYTNTLTQNKTARDIQLESKVSDYTRLADWLKQNTNAKDSVLIFSDVPAVYSLAGARNASRFPYMRWADEAGSDDMRETYEKALYDDLFRNKPKYFILSKDGFPWQEAKFGDTLKKLTIVNSYFEKNYTYVSDVGPFAVFQRN